MLELDFEIGMELLGEAYRTYRDERFWQLYVSVFPTMTEETFQTFEEFKKYQTAPPAERHTKEQILDKVSGIINNIKWEKAEI